MEVETYVSTFPTKDERMNDAVTWCLGFVLAWNYPRLFSRERKRMWKRGSRSRLRAKGVSFGVVFCWSSFFFLGGGWAENENKGRRGKK